MLRLVGEDPADVEVISAAVQDAVLRVSELAYDRKARRFTAAMRRFQWEEAVNGAPYYRTPSLLAVDGVLGVQSRNVRLAARNAAAALLALRFEPAPEPPSGNLTLALAGGGEIRLNVECIDITLADFGQRRRVRHRPEHAE